MYEVRGNCQTTTQTSLVVQPSIIHIDCEMRSLWRVVFHRCFALNAAVPLPPYPVSRLNIRLVRFSRGRSVGRFLVETYTSKNFLKRTRLLRYYTRNRIPSTQRTVQQCKT